MPYDDFIGRSLKIRRGPFPFIVITDVLTDQLRRIVMILPCADLLGYINTFLSGYQSWHQLGHMLADSEYGTILYKI